MNPFCPNFSNKEVKQQFENIQRIVGEDAAYYLWDKYEGNYDQAFKEAQSISDYSKVGRDSNPALYNINDSILELKYQFDQVKGIGKRHGRDTYLSETGYLTQNEAQQEIGKLGYQLVAAPVEDRGRWYIKKITGKEFKEQIAKLYARRNYLIASGVPLFGDPESTTTDTSLKDRLFNGKDEASVSSMLTRLAKDNPQHRTIILTLQKGLSTRTKARKIVLTDFESDPRIPIQDGKDAGLYIPSDGTIYINQRAAFPGKNGKADMTILHEIIHLSTYEAVHGNAELYSHLEKLLDHVRIELARKYDKKSYTQLQNNVSGYNTFYGLTSVDEMLAELTTNAAFARELMSVKPTTNSFKSVLDQFVQWLLRVFGVDPQDTIYTELYSQLNDIIINRQELNELYNDFLDRHQDYQLSLQQLDEVLLYQDPGYEREALPSPQRPSIKNLVDAYNKMSSDIDFDEQTHTYTNKHTGQVYQSVSDVKTSVGYGEQEDRLPEEAVSLGNFTKVIGTNIHLALHEMLVDQFNASQHKDLSPTVISQLKSIVNNIKEKYTIVASEQIVYNDQYNVAGTIDLIVYDKKTKKIVLLDFKSKARKIGDAKKNGFNYYRSSKYGKPDADKHNFQLTMYEKLHNLLGFKIDERGIVPIEYECTEDGTLTNVYLSQSDKYSTLEDKGYYTMPHRSQIDLDIDTYVLTEEQKDAIDQIQVDRQREIIKDITTTLRNKIVNLFSKGRNAQATDTEALLSGFNSMSEQEIILSYIDSALRNLKNIVEGKNGYNDRLKQSRVQGAEVWNLKQLENWRDIARSYKQLEEIQAYLFDYQDLLPEGAYDKIMPILDDAIRYRDILEGAYKSKGKDLWIKWITPFIKNIEGAYRIKAEKQYKQEHKSNVDQEDMQKYIDKYISDNKTKIQLETRDFIQQQSIMAEADVNGFYRWVDTIFQSKDPIISGMALAYDQTVQQTNETFNEKYRQLVSLTREMESKFGTSITTDPKRIYDFMLEETEDGVKLISEIPESFRKAYSVKMAEIDADTSYKDNFERFKAKMKWLDENAPIKDKKGLKEAKLKAVQNYLNSIDISREEYELIIDNEKKTGKHRKSYYDLSKEGVISYKRADDLRELTQDITYKFRVFDKTKYPNSKWEKLQQLRQKDPNDIRVRFFDFIKQLADEGDARVAPRYRLNGRLPGVRKTSIERIAEGQSKIQVAKESISDALSLQADDTMYGQYDLTDETNRPINYVPVFYTSKVKPSDQSFDIPNIYKMWFKSALSYANTVEILDQLEFTRFIVNNRQTKAGNVSYASKVWKRLHPDSQIDESSAIKDSSNLANQLNDWFDMVIYGKGQDSLGQFETPFFGKIDMGKVVNLFSKYVSLRTMGLNYISMVNNMAQAEVAQTIETMSKQYVSPKSYSKASWEFTINLPEILGDVGSRMPTNKINLLNMLFMTVGEYTDGNMRLSNKFSRLFNSGAFYFTTNLGEYEAQSRFLIANLIEQRALDKDGNDIGSIYDYYEVVDGELVFDKDGKVANWDDNKRRALSSRIRSILMSMHGNYSEKDRVALQRNGYLKLALMFRKWIIPTWRKRYDKLYYDNVMQDYREGYYRTGGRFLAQNVKKFFYKLTDESKAAEIAITADWHNLTEYEKANVRRFATEATIITSLMILYSIVKGFADDDDDKFIDNIAYQLYRLRTDIGFYTNPRDAFKIIQSPFPSTSAIKSFTSLIETVMNPLDRYERGPWKDHLKLEKRMYDLLPVVRQLYRARDIENEYNILNMK